MTLELRPEVLDHRADRHCHRVTQQAQAVADDVALHVRHHFEVHRRRLAPVDALQHLHRPVRPLPARDALAARLVPVELRQAQRDGHDRDGVVDHDDRPGAQHRAGLGHVLEVVGQVEVLLGQDRGRRAAREPGLHAPSRGRAARQAADDLPRGDAQLDLVVAGALHVAGDRDDLRARRALGPELLEPIRAVHDDVRDVAERLHVVDQRGPLVETLVGRERGLQAGIAPLALERVEERRLLAADVRPGPAVHDEVAREVRPQDPLARVPARISLRESGVEDVGLLLVLAPDVDEGVVGPGGVGADQHALDQLVRIAVNQLAVLERPRLGLVGVAAQVLVDFAVGQEAGLLAHREAGAAAAPQAGELELSDDLVRRHLGQRPAQAAIAAQALVGVDAVQVRHAGVLEQDAGHVPSLVRASRRRFSGRTSAGEPPSRRCAAIV